MPDTTPDVVRKPRRTLVLRISLSTVLVVLGIVVVLWKIGSVGNRQWNQTRQSSVQQIRTADGAGEYSICVVELDDQGVLWDPRQLDWTLEHLEATSEASPAGTLVLVFVHGWKQNAAGGGDPRSRLSVFNRDLERLTERAQSGREPQPSVVGIYVGWRGRSLSLPLVENLTFWNRRVAAARTASVDLLETLLKIGTVVARYPANKSMVMGHSLGGDVVGRSLAPALVGTGVHVVGASRPNPVLFDLIVLANPATSALDAERLISFFDRNHLHLVTMDSDGETRVAAGPLIASINSEADLVNRFSYPIGMWVNSLILRFRDDHPHGTPSQRQLAIRAAGHEPSLISHEARVAADGAIEITPTQLAKAGAPYWVIRVPQEISAGHSDITGESFRDLIIELMERNQVFDSSVEIALAVDTAAP